MSEQTWQAPTFTVGGIVIDEQGQSWFCSGWWVQGGRTYFRLEAIPPGESSSSYGRTWGDSLAPPVLPEFEVYGHGLCCLSVCTNLTDTVEIERRANAENPTGLDHGWTISTDPTFSGGEPMPGPCSRHPGRQHYLLKC
jgi:hypothetical protein